MKKLLNIILIVFICFLLINSPIFAGWTNMGEYKEMKPGLNEITQLLVPENDTCFYLVNKSGIFQCYNYQADLISTISLDLSDSIAQLLRISNDAK